MEATLLERWKTEILLYSDEDKIKMFLEETRIYLNAVRNIDAAAYSLLLMYLVLHEKPNDKRTESLVQSLLSARDRYMPKGEWSNHLKFIEQKLGVILDSLNTKVLKQNYFHLFLDVLNLCDEFVKCEDEIVSLSLEKRCYLSLIIIKLLSPEGFVFNPRANCGWLSIFLPKCCKYIGSSSKKELNLMDRLFQLDNNKIFKFYNTNYPSKVEFDCLIWFADYSHRYRLGTSRITDSIASEYNKIFNHYIPSMPIHGKAACVVSDAFLKFGIRYDRYKKPLFDNDWVERILFVDNGMSVIFINKQKKQKGVVEIIDRVADNNMDVSDLLDGIKEGKKTYVITIQEIIEQNYRLDIMDLVREKNKPKVLKGMKLVQLRDVLSFNIQSSNTDNVIELSHHLETDYSPFKMDVSVVGDAKCLSVCSDRRMYLSVDTCNPYTFQPQLFESNKEISFCGECRDIYVVNTELVDGHYLVNELCKSYFKEQLFPYEMYNLGDDPLSVSDVFLNLYIQVPDCETSVERQKNIFRAEKLEYINKMNNSLGYNMEKISANRERSPLPKGTMLLNGKYRIEYPIGNGGFGKTYKATEFINVGGRVLKSDIAIKEFFIHAYQKRAVGTLMVETPCEKVEDISRAQKKFMNEVNKIKQFSDHPHIVNVYDVFDENGTCYYTMEYIEGGSLLEYVEQTETCSLQEQESLKIIREVASALSEMHKHRMNHLDVKPENILMNDEGKAVLIDFGAAHKFSNDDETSSLLAITSGGFSPLEIGQIKDFSPATDIYSLGATLYWLLTGEQPPRGGLSERDEKPVCISDKIWKALCVTLRIRREERPQSIEEFLAMFD